MYQHHHVHGRRRKEDIPAADVAIFCRFCNPFPCTHFKDFCLAFFKLLRCVTLLGDFDFRMKAKQTTNEGGWTFNDGMTFMTHLR